MQGIYAPLFILREECGRDLEGVLEKLAHLGYDGVELLGLFGRSPESLRHTADRLQLRLLGDHVPFSAFSADAEGVFSRYAVLGCPYITISELPWDEGTDFVAGHVGEWADAASRRGMTLLFHNHAGEFSRQPSLLDTLLEHPAAQKLALEPDLGWMAIAGADYRELLRKYRSRCPVIHLKDYYADRPGKIDVSGLGDTRGGEREAHFAFRPTGYGIMNYPLLREDILACQPAAFVADHDCAYEDDPYRQLQDSLSYIQRWLTL